MSSPVVNNPPQVRFKEGAIEFSNLVADLIVRAHDNFVPITTTPALLSIASLAMKSQDPDMLMTTFIEKSYPHWEAIKKQNIVFFMKEGMVIFEGLPEKNVEDFHRLFKSNIYTPEDANVKMNAELYNLIETKGYRDGNTISLIESPDGKVVKSKQVFKVEPLIHPEVMKQIWIFFQNSCKQSVSYIHFRRCPDPQTKKYTKAFLPVIRNVKVSVKEATELWGILKYA